MEMIVENYASDNELSSIVKEKDSKTNIRKAQANEQRLKKHKVILLNSCGYKKKCDQLFTFEERLNYNSDFWSGFVSQRQAIKNKYVLKKTVTRRTVAPGKNGEFKKNYSFQFYFPNDHNGLEEVFLRARWV
jgi:hypothetical protein